MEGKLIKDREHYYLTVNEILYAEIGGHPLKSINKGLSLKNCKAIDNGYDLDELVCDEIGIDISVIKHIDTKLETDSSPNTPIREAGAVGAGLYHMAKGFEIGFQKAIELLGDKKYSEENMIEFAKWVFLEVGSNSGKDRTNEELLLEWKSRQQTSWDVEIDMEEVSEEYRDGTIKVVTIPKLDSDGCLILKRK